MLADSSKQNGGQNKMAAVGAIMGSPSGHCALCHAAFRHQRRENMSRYVNKGEKTPELQRKHLTTR